MSKTAKVSRRACVSVGEAVPHLCVSIATSESAQANLDNSNPLQGLYFDDPRIVDALAGGAAGMSVPGRCWQLHSAFSSFPTYLSDPTR